MFNLFQAKKYQDISEGEFSELMKAQDTVVLDVRTKEEFQASHLAEAQNIDFLDPMKFNHDVDLLDKNKTYLIYCRSGARSASACSVMADKEFSKLYNLRGGIMSWTGELV